MKLLLSQWMQELDREAIHDIGIPSIVLMENASRGAAHFFIREFSLNRDPHHVVVIAGKGNNGGDGLAVGRILHQYQIPVTFLLLASPDSLTPDSKINFDIIQHLKLDIRIPETSLELSEILLELKTQTKIPLLIIDAIFGTGLDRPLKSGIYADAVQLINQSGAGVAAIDIPSGLSESFLPEDGLHVIAHATATFQCLKAVHLYPDGNPYCGKIEIIDIGIPKELIAKEKYNIEIITPSIFKPLFEKRPVDAHKGNFGHALTIAGSPNKPGAGILCSYAVLKCGAGLCTAAVPFENRIATITAHPELMTFGYQKNQELQPILSQYDTILAGPGLGDTSESLETISLLLNECHVPLVLDADSLNVLEKGKDLLRKGRRSPVIITPHPGEFSRLTGKTTQEIRKNRIQSALNFAERFNVYVVLKGHHTVIATPAGKAFVNPTGNAGMATAGSGDVLAGMIAGMICTFQKKYPLEIILQAAVFCHGHAGDLAARSIGETSLTAGDLIQFIPAALTHLDSNDLNTIFNFT